MAPMAADQPQVVDAAGQQAGVVEDDHQHAQQEQGDDGEPDPPGLVLTFFGSAACSGWTATDAAALGGPPPGRAALLLRLARAPCWPWLPWAKDSQSPAGQGAGSARRPVDRYDQWTMGTRVLVIDNYDSFVYNLVQELGELGADPVVHRNDAIDIDGIRAASPDAILISPGPGPARGRRHLHDGRSASWPASSPSSGCASATRPSARSTGASRGGPHPHARQDLGHPPRRPGRVRRPARPLRRHPLPLAGGRAGQRARRASRSPPARRDGVIMGLRHRTLAVEGVQFHPESLLTPEGPSLLSNFLAADRRRV